MRKIRLIITLLVAIVIVIISICVSCLLYVDSTSFALNKHKLNSINDVQEKIQPNERHTTYSQDKTILNHLNIRGEKYINESNSNKTATEFFIIYKYKLKITDVVIAVFTGLLVLATFRLQEATERLVERAELSSERQLRAYVFVTEPILVAADTNGNIIEPLQKIKSGGCPVARIEITNTGQTPAYDVKIYGDICIVDWPLKLSVLPLLQFDKLEMTKESLGAGNKRLKFDRLSRELNDVNIEKLNSGELAIFVYGEVRYKDTFGKQRFTKYRFFMGGPIGIRGISLSAHEEGNEAN